MSAWVLFDRKSPLKGYFWVAGTRQAYNVETGERGDSSLFTSLVHLIYVPETEYSNQVFEVKELIGKTQQGDLVIEWYRSLEFPSYPDTESKS